MQPQPTIWQNQEFRSYISATGFTQFAFSMQQLLTSWMMIGELHEDADKVGVAQALIGLPGLALMLWGGANADRRDQRKTLIVLYGLMGLPSLGLALYAHYFGINFLSITLWALAISICSSMANPALQAMLNRICGTQVQQGVTASTAVGFGVQLAGLTLAGQIKTLGLVNVLIIQGVFVLIGSWMIRRLRAGENIAPTTQNMLSSIIEGFRMVAQHQVIAPVMMLNLISMLFNAGAFAIVFPYLMTKVYGGDAQFLALTMVVFFGGATISNFAMLRIMPILHLGRWFLLMQLSRVVILILLWLHPPLWLLLVCVFAWGLNMGITTTTSRAIVQEAAEASHRGRMLAVFNFGAMGAQPIGALLLGWCIAQFGILHSLLPGVVVSLVIYLYGTLRTQLWNYQSPAALQMRKAAIS